MYSCCLYVRTRISASGSHASSAPIIMTKLRLYMILVVATSLLVVYLWGSSDASPHIHHSAQSSKELKSIYQHIPFDGIFKDFNNDSGTSNGSLIVPNIVHFLRFNLKEFNFVDMVCVLAAYRNLRPEKIMFHTNVPNFEGDRWDRIRSTPGINIEVLHLDMPREIFGQKFNKDWVVWHSGDVTRIRILMKYGGIFLDNDVYAVKSFDLFRRYEMVLGWDEGQCLGSQVLVAHKDARFLRFWLHSYQEYFSNEWYYNAGCKPTYEVLHIHPELVHRVKLLFGVHQLIRQLYKSSWNAWRQQYAIHLLIRHRSYLDKEHLAEWPEFNEENILNYNMTFGEMAREVYGIC